MRSLPRPFRRTLGEFAFQLITIIAGILIALWVESVASVSASFFATTGGGQTRMRPTEREASRARLLDALGGLTVHRSLVTQLRTDYRKLPKV